jgi:nucleoside-diphosphate-sugar epimerase
MRRALVIGGGGYVGSRLSSRLAQENWDVTALTLPDRREPHDHIAPRARIVHGDRREAGMLRRLLAQDCDVVFDLISYHPDDTSAVVAGGTGRLGRLVHLSTVSVYRDYPTSGAATEHRMSCFNEDATGYGPQKAACERVLKRAAIERNFPSVILRAAPIIGPGDPCSRENYFVRRILAGRPILHPGPLSGFLWLLFIDDLIDALMRAGTAPALGQTIHLAHDDAPTLHDHVEALAHCLNRPAPAFHVLTIEHLTELGLRPYGFPYARTVNILPDTSAALLALSWRATPYREALAKTFDDLRPPRSDARPAWPGRDTMQARLSGTHEWLHAAQEARVLANFPSAPQPNADTILGWLSDDPTEHASLMLVQVDRWADLLGGGSGSKSMNDNIGQQLVSIPDELRRRLEASGGRKPHKTLRLERDGAAGLDLRNLVGAVEHDRWDAERAWVYVAAASTMMASYGLSQQPQLVGIMAYSSAMGLSVPSDQRILLETSTHHDADMLKRHLRDCEAEGLLRVDDVGSWARLYVIGAARWLPQALRRMTGMGDVIEGGPLDTGDAGWVLTHAVARLIWRAGIEGPAIIRMGRSSVDTVEGRVAIPPTAALCETADRFLVVDLIARRVVEVPPTMARVLSNGHHQSLAFPSQSRAL